MKTTVTITINTEVLNSYTDTYLAQLWHIAQANPEDSNASRAPGQLAEAIGREIIRRWLARTEPELWHHNGADFADNTLRRHGRWVNPTTWQPNQQQDGT